MDSYALVWGLSMGVFKLEQVTLISGRSPKEILEAFQRGEDLQELGEGCVPEDSGFPDIGDELIDYSPYDLGGWTVVDEGHSRSRHLYIRGLGDQS